MKVYLQLFGCIILLVIGQIFLKHGMNSIKHFSFSEFFSSGILRLFRSPYLILGFMFYGISTVIWLEILTKLELSYALPILSLSYAFNFFAAWFFLGENVSLLRFIGIVVICIGVYLVSQS